MPTMREYQKPGGEGQPTVTEKSSGLEYVKASLEPTQEKSVQRREDATKNDKKG